MKIEWKSCYKVIISIFLLYLCFIYWPKAEGLFFAVLSAASPLIIGGVIAYLVNILMSMYERNYFPKSQKELVKKSKRPVCMISAYLTLIAIVVLVIGLVLPQLVSCIQLLLAEMPALMRKMVDILEKIEIIPQDIIAFLQNINWQSKISQLINMITTGIGNAMGLMVNMISSVFSGIVTAFLSIIFSFYLLAGKETLHHQTDRVLKHYLKKEWYDKVIYVADVLNDCFRRYIVGQCTEAVILGLLCMIGMGILRLPYASMLGALIAFTALIPVAGAYIGAGVGAFMILTVSPVQALIFLIFIVVLQQLEGNIIYPKVVGSSLGLPGIWVLAAVTVGGGMMGVTGMLLGVPIFATAYRLLKNDMNKNEVVEVIATASDNVESK
ncbi:MAG: AI-2E family transporter [Schaedlerella sp.]|nr:AI-2E family transporter [Schaedlerella sp.]